ncbi:hypothetical protein FRB94_002512 [Tulasnella sp. JGI-2019a]|nr:hypothetical protein FRB94_002512 [Tulasnella sp. JGI-2019a]KAG9037359.1 hypothetical protein FRB95_005999 [Tulasnella sp. JGI-2019a]
MFSFLASLHAVAVYLTSTDVVQNAKAASSSPQPSERAESTSLLSTSSIATADSSKKTSKIKASQRGIYTYWEEQYEWTDFVPLLELWRNLAQFYASWPYFGRFLRDVYAQGPMLCVLVMTAKLMEHIIPTLTLIQSSYVLNVLNQAFTTRRFARQELVFVIAVKALCCGLNWAVDQMNWFLLPVLKYRVKNHFKQRLLAVQLRIDLPTSQRVDVKSKLESVENYSGWDAFDTLLQLLGLFLQIILQGGFLLGSLRHQPGGNAIALLSLMVPVVSLFEDGFGSKAYHAVVTNVGYLRIDLLRKFTSNMDVKKEILGYAMAGYIEKEYTAARRELGDAEADTSGWSGRQPFSMFSLLRRLISESPVVVLAIRAFTSPETTPLTSIALLQQTTSTIESTIYNLFYRSGSVVESFVKLKALYDIDDIENVIKDGSKEYPRRDADGKRSNQGMKIEFKDVSFKYPGKDTMVIDGLSFSLPAGSICVIVGENGCGKSSTIKLLTRLYDVDAGEILVDDLPLKEYKIDDIRGATAIMHQDYHHFNLTLRENISLGNITHSDDMDAIKEAARLGQASDFIEKLPSSYDTSTRAGELVHSSWNLEKGSALDLMIKERKASDISFSGGEKQRLALSRTFMRSTTSDTRLLAYDEPSAALDPKAEFALFERLRHLRGNKTMIFVTHRFGYLTKYADLIIYMDKGKAVEQGSHEELLALDGQYAHLYNVQAQAFA